MTKEEIEIEADQFAEKHGPSNAYCSMTEIEGNYREITGLKKGFIAGYEKGLEEGSKLKYHDLLENPNDLPDTNREVLVLLWDYDNYHIGRYEEEYDDVIRGNTYWHFDDFSIEKDKLDIVLGWFERPKVNRR